MFSATPFHFTPRPQQVLSDNYMSPVERDERYERITRTAMRLLEIPIAFIAMDDEDAPWLRSAHGLPAHQTSYALAFCGPAASDKPHLIEDASRVPAYWENPLVTGPAHVRSMLSVPLHLGDGTRGASLCVMASEPYAFRQSDVLGLQDLARLAQAELQLDTLNDTHKRALIRLGQMERRALYDQVAGCLQVRPFRELLASRLADAREDGTALALCYVRVRNLDELAGAGDKARATALRQLVAQVLRQRVPEQGALAALGGTDFCALIPADSIDGVQERLAAFVAPVLALDAPGIRLDLDLQLDVGQALLHEMPGRSSATELWATALANLDA